MIRYLHGLSHGALLCAVGLGAWVYGMSFWDKLNLQLWYLTTGWPSWVPLPW